jgi:hypothetical protein
MPVYTAEPSGAERAAAATLLEKAAAGVSAADVLEGLPATPASPLVPSPRVPGPEERISA